jgi:hypothetical protein
MITATAVQKEIADGRNATHTATGAMQSEATKVAIAYVLLPTSAKPAPGQSQDRLNAFFRIAASGKTPSSSTVKLPVVTMNLRNQAAAFT